MAYAAIAIEEDDGAKLFRVIDVRARHAMISVVNDRRAAAEIVRRDYPEGERARTLEWLGDAAEVVDASELFARRCAQTCRDELASRIGAVVSRERVDEIERVTTTRGTVDLHREAEGHWWGIVWRTGELDEERNRASHDLAAVERNATTHRRRSELDAP